MKSMGTLYIKKRSHKSLPPHLHNLFAMARPKPIAQISQNGCKEILYLLPSIVAVPKVCTLKRRQSGAVRSYMSENGNINI